MFNFKSNLTCLAVGFAAGVGVGAFGRELFTNGGRTFKPLTKGLIKGGLTLMEKGKESFAYMTESITDLAAEAKAELRPVAIGAGAEKQAGKAAASAGASDLGRKRSRAKPEAMA